MATRSSYRVAAILRLPFPCRGAVSQYKTQTGNHLSDTHLGVPRNELQTFRDWIENLPDVTKAPHRFGGVEFQVHGLEFMHFHGETQLDIHLSKEDQARMLAENKAEHHQFAFEAGWVTVRIRSTKDLDNAREVVQLAYSRAKRIIETHLARRAASRRRAL
jgi:hypothetical protein